MMSSWTKQKGYPAVYVKIKRHELEIDQVWFLIFLSVTWTLFFVYFNFFLSILSYRQVFMNGRDINGTAFGIFNVHFLNLLLETDSFKFLYCKPFT